MNDLINVTRHLDLGCGLKPRNPYKRDYLYGCDIKNFQETYMQGNYFFKEADLCQEKIPFEDGYFDSISAFDFVEHIPRYLVNSTGKSFLPFIELMSEIYRVLRPGGIFLASTPAYPRPEAFQDPTHVNIITDRTHLYFCGTDPYASRYGFVGKFSEKRVGWDAPKNLWNQDESNFRKIFRNFERKCFKGGISHLTWELVAEK